MFRDQVWRKMRWTGISSWWDPLIKYMSFVCNEWPLSILLPALRAIILETAQRTTARIAKKERMESSEPPGSHQRCGGRTGDERIHVCKERGVGSANCYGKAHQIFRLRLTEFQNVFWCVWCTQWKIIRRRQVMSLRNKGLKLEPISVLTKWTRSD